MSKKISRRDFLKLAGVGAATTAVLTGCGPASRLVVREPYTQMPEYTHHGKSTYFATTCRECAAGCGLIVRTYQGRAIKTEGNPNHPVNLGKTCARGQATLQGLYNPDRVTEPVRGGSKIEWDEAVSVVEDALRSGNAAFMLGMAPDHLYDLVTDMGVETIRYSTLSAFEARATLVRATEEALGEKGMPFFDVGNADFVLSFGANFLETWLSPVAYTREFAKLRKGERGRRGLFAQVEPRISQTAAKADMWLPARPGTEGLVALAIGKLAAEARGGEIPAAFEGVNVIATAAQADISFELLEKVAMHFAEAERPLAIPGGTALAHSNGVQIATAIFALNAFTGNFGQVGGVFISPMAPVVDEYHRPANMKEMAAFIEKLNSGAIKTLFVHGVNPAFELPKVLGFAEALTNVETVISFATFPDETAELADYVFPDHHGLESWGYQRVVTGTTQSALSGAQPVVVPYHNTMSTVDVLLAAGGMPFADEVEFIQSKISPLMADMNANFSSDSAPTFYAFFQQFGGWWSKAEGLVAPSVEMQAVELDAAEFEGEGEFYLIPFMSPTLAEAGANKPWLQEIPDPMTTVMWNTWLEVNPETAHELDLHDDDVVIVKSEFGTVELPVYLYPAIRPDTIAMAFGQGHTAYGRYAEGRGVNPVDVLGMKFNTAGDLAFAATRVKIEKTGKTQELARLESKLGVYGEGLGEEH